MLLTVWTPQSIKLNYLGIGYMIKRLYILLSILCSSAFLFAEDSISISAGKDSTNVNPVQNKKSESQNDDFVLLKQEADSAFSKEEFEEAITLYKKIAKETESADICYNLGCSYYRMDNMANSVLWFERAYLLNPGDDDIRHNLELARSKTIDKIIPRHEMFFVTVYRNIVNLMSLHSWAITCLVLFLLSLIAFSLYLYSNRILIRKISFFSAIILILLVIFGNICAFQQCSWARNRVSGIIMQSAVTVKSTPSENGNDLFVIHEGTKIEIHDNSLKDWCEVQIADGKVGWIQKNTFELI